MLLKYAQSRERLGNGRNTVDAVGGYNLRTYSGLISVSRSMV